MVPCDVLLSTLFYIGVEGCGLEGSVFLVLCSLTFPHDLVRWGMKTRRWLGGVPVRWECYSSIRAYLRGDKPGDKGRLDGYDMVLMSACMSGATYAQGGDDAKLLVVDLSKEKLYIQHVGGRRRVLPISKRKGVRHVMLPYAYGVWVCYAYGVWVPCYE